MPHLTPDFQAWLRSAAERLDPGNAWPAEQVEKLRSAGVLQWTVPSRFGGQELSDADLLQGYLDLSRSCLTTAFLLTQHNAAVQRLASGSENDWAAELLTAVARDGVWCTVGISHFSTSRQHLQRPVVTAKQTPDGTWRLSGSVPWVTGAARADWLVTGGVLPDDRQVLLGVERGSPGVTIEAPLPLMALNATQTGRVRLDQVLVPADRVVAGPAGQVMKVGTKGGTGSLTTSVLALGTALKILDRLNDEAQSRETLREVVSLLRSEAGELQTRLLMPSTPEQGSAGSAEELRFRANSLVSRTSQAYLAACKGAGYVQGHPAERAVREAMFFQVWSCPQAVVNSTLSDLTCRD